MWVYVGNRFFHHPNLPQALTCERLMQVLEWRAVGVPFLKALNVRYAT